MAYSDRLQTNNTNLQACINKANALPDAGSSGGSGSAETCTVNFINQAGLYAVEYYYTALDESGKILAVCESNTSSGNMTFTNVLCGSFMCCNCISYQTYDLICENSEEIPSGASSTTSFFRITATQGETATITFTGSGNSGYDNWQ